MEPWHLSAVDALARLRDGRLTAAALTDACLGRIAARDPTVRAFAHFDPAAAMRQAEACDRAGRDGALAGLGVGVKDIIDTADMPTRYGSKAYPDHRPAADAAVVGLLRQAQAIIPGKTTTTEFAGPEPSPTRNPHNPAFSPGGSSAGSAAAVADGMLPFAIGTQTAGSIVRPAAFCGVVGLKPSFGAIDLSGVRPTGPSFDTVGTFGRDVADAALMLSVLADDAGLAQTAADAVRPRIGLCRTPAWSSATSDVERAVEEAAARLAAAGALVSEIVAPPAFASLIADHGLVMAVEMTRATPEVATARAVLGAATIALVEQGAAVTPAAEAAARGRLDAVRAAFASLFKGVDVLIGPSAAAEAPEGLGSTGDPLFNRLGSTGRGPCLTLPLGVGPHGLPVGLQVYGAPGRDRGTIAAALWIERVIGKGVPAWA